MPTSRSQVRQTLIVNKLRQNAAPLKEIESYLARQSELQGYTLTVDKKTFRRDLDNILSMYHIEIKYDPGKRVYFIASDHQQEASRRLFEAFETFNALNVADGLSQYVHFENRKSVGTESLFSLLQAIKKQLRIRFTFHDFWEEHERQCEAEPFALKEFKHRWYILANDLADGAVKRFSLDRLTNLEITKTTFEPTVPFNVEEAYRNSFGIIPPNATKPVQIILAFEWYQGKYISSLPLHNSQQVIPGMEGELWISLNLHITHDLIMELLSFGDRVRVIKPEKLRKQMRDILQRAINRYDAN